MLPINPHHCHLSFHELPLQRANRAKESSITGVGAFFEPSAVVNVDGRDRNTVKRPRNEVNG